MNTQPKAIKLITELRFFFVLALVKRGVFVHPTEMLSTLDDPFPEGREAEAEAAALDDTHEEEEPGDVQDEELFNLEEFEGAQASVADIEVDTLDENAQRTNVHYTHVRTANPKHRQPESMSREDFYKHIEQCYKEAYPVEGSESASILQFGMVAEEEPRHFGVAILAQVCTALNKSCRRSQWGVR